MALLYTAQGTPENVPDSQVIEALRSGQYALPPGQDTINMTSPDGEVYSFDLNNAIEASNEGWSFETGQDRYEREIQEEHGDLGGQALSVAAGAARGLTFGLSDLALVESGAVSEDTLNALRDANPVASQVGELGTIGASILASGGTGLLARAGMAPRAAARLGVAAERGISRRLTDAASGGLFSRAAAKAASVGAGSAIEGALYSGGQLITESALGNLDMTAENLLSHVGMGTFLAGGLGGGLGAGFVGAGALGKGVGALGKDASKGLVKLWERQTGNKALPGLREFARKTWSKAAGIVTDKGDEILEVSTKEGRKIARQDLEEVLDRLAREGKKLDDAILPEFDKITEFTKKLKPSQIKKMIPKGVDAQALTAFDDTMTGVLNRLDDMIANPGDYGDLAAVKKLERNLRSKDNKVNISALGPSDISPTVFNILDNAKRDIGRRADKLGGMRAKNTQDMATFETLKDVYEDIRRTLEDTRIFGEAATAQKTLNQAWSDMLESNAYRARNRLEKIVGNKEFEKIFASDPSGFKMFFKNLGRAENDLDLQYWTKLWTDRANVARAHAKAYGWNKISNPKQIAAIEKIEKRTKDLQTLLKKAEKEVGLINQLKSLEEASRLSGFGAELGGVGGFLIGGPVGAAAGAVLGSLNAPGRIIRQLSTIDRITAAIRIKARGSINRYVNNAKKTTKTVRAGRPVRVKRLLAPASVGAMERSTGAKTQQQAYDKIIENLTQISSDPEQTKTKLDNSVRDLHPVAPILAEKIQIKAVQAADFLLQRAPKSPMRPSVFKSPWKPSKSALGKFERYYAAIENPASVLKDIENGTITREAIEALAEIYPETYGEVINQLFENLDKLQDLPYKERLRLSIVFQRPLDPTMEPAFINRMQENQPIVDEEALAAPQTQVRGKLTADRHLSASQRLSLKG